MSSPPRAPAGFEPNLFPSPFLAGFGDLLWGRSQTNGLLELAVFTERRHLNSRGSVHGGLLSSLADVLLGHAAAATRPSRTMPPRDG